MFSCLTSNSENCFASLWSWPTSDTCEQIFQPRKTNHIPQSCFVAETAFFPLPYMFSIWFNVCGLGWPLHSINPGGHWLALWIQIGPWSLELEKQAQNNSMRPPPIMICLTPSSKVFTVHWGLNGVSCHLSLGQSMWVFMWAFFP